MNREDEVPDQVPIPCRRFVNRLFSALRLVGAIRLAFDVRKLAIAALGLALLQSGWSLLDRLVPSVGDATADVLELSAFETNVAEPAVWPAVSIRQYQFRLSEPV